MAVIEREPGDARDAGSAVAEPVAPTPVPSAAPTADREAGRRLAPRHVRLVIALLMLAALGRGVLWTSVLPAWQGPDETAHYSYAEEIEAQHRIPMLTSDPRPRRLSDAVSASWAATGFDAFRLRLAARPFDDPEHRRFPVEPSGLAQRSEGTLDADRYPPAYYLLCAAAMSLPSLDTATDRLFAARLISVLLGALLVPATFRLARVAGARPTPALAAAAFVSLLPMISQASAIVNPDVLLILSGTMLTAACLEATAGRPTRRQLAWVALWTAVTMASKTTGTPLAALILAGVAGLRLGPRISLRRRLSIAGLAALAVLPVLALAGSAFYRLSIFGGVGPLQAVRFGLSYAWQYYLPPLPFMRSMGVGGFHSTAAWHVWVRDGVGNFSWMSTYMPEWTYRVAAASVVLVLVAAGVGAWSSRRQGRPVVLPIAVTCVAFVAFLHATEVSAMLGGMPPILQGRYLLPLAPLAAAAVALGLSRLSRRVGDSIALAGCAVWFVLSLVAVRSVAAYFA